MQPIRYVGIQIIYDDGTNTIMGKWSLPAPGQYGSIIQLAAEIGAMLVEAFVKQVGPQIIKASVIPWENIENTKALDDTITEEK